MYNSSTGGETMMKKVVILGGGTGLSAVIKSLKHFPLELTAVITVSDSGSSTGRLREEFNAPAVGDIRKVLSNFSTLPEEIENIFEYRFKTYSDLDNHPVGNLLLTALLEKTGSLKTAIEYMSKILDVKHKVLPLSEDYLTLMGETVDGQIVEGEDQIPKQNQKYKKIFYKEEPHVLKEVLNQIENADLIILSMGSLYTSLLPHLICKEVQESLRKTKAELMYICNAMTQPGETDDFKVSDHIRVIEEYIAPRKVDVVITSNTKINKQVLEKYATEELKDPVTIDYKNLDEMNLEVIEADLITTSDGTIRHNSMKLSSIIFSYLMR